MGVVCVFLWGRGLVGGGVSGALFADALAGPAHLTVQLHHLQHGLLAAAAQVVEQAVVLLRETVQHAEHVTTATRAQLLLHQLQFGLTAETASAILLFRSRAALRRLVFLLRPRALLWGRLAVRH